MRITVSTSTINIPPFIHHLLDFIFPSICPLCGAFSNNNASNASFCKECSDIIRHIRSPFCPICGRPFPSEVAIEHLCKNCFKKRIPFDMARSLFFYEGKIREAIHKLKYERKFSIARYLGKMMADYHEKDFNFLHYDLLLPVPLHIKRLKERHYNQSLLLSYQMGKTHGIRVDKDSLIREKNSVPQTGLKLRERKDNVKNAFVLRKIDTIKGKKVLLIDDVYTSGATVIECAKTLKRGGAKRVDVLTCARTVTT